MAKETTAEKSVKAVKAAQPAKPGFFTRLGNYFRDVRSEMRRVVWPNRAEVQNSSMVVVVTLLFFIVFITITDLAVQQILSLIAKIKVG